MFLLMPHNQAACNKIWSIVKLLDAVQDAFASAVAHIILVSHYLRNRDNGNSKITCNILQGHSHSKTILTTLHEELPSLGVNFSNDPVNATDSPS